MTVRAVAIMHDLARLPGSWPRCDRSPDLARGGHDRRRFRKRITNLWHGSCATPERGLGHVL
jgi:hypothetical protein